MLSGQDALLSAGQQGLLVVLLSTVLRESVTELDALCRAHRA
ncbi:hypothetical protein [Quadrisphaera sp. KR29]